LTPVDISIIEKERDMAPQIRTFTLRPWIRRHLLDISCSPRYISKRSISLRFFVFIIKSLEAVSKTGEILSFHIGTAIFMGRLPP